MHFSLTELGPAGVFRKPLELFDFFLLPLPFVYVHIAHNLGYAYGRGSP